MKLPKLIVAIVLMAITAGTAWSQEGAGKGSPVKPLPSAGQIGSRSAPPAFASGDLTMAEALSRTLKQNQSLASFAEEIRARDAAALQAGLLPNPELGVDVENFGGENELESFDGAETTIALSQLLELGGKRGKRRQVATLEKELSVWDYESRKLEVLSGAAKTFIALLTAQHQVAQLEESVRLFEKTLAAVSERVGAGKVSPVEEVRARVALATARTAAEQARRGRQAARARLSAYWGESRPQFERAVGDLSAIAALPEVNAIFDLLTKNPDLARWRTEIDQREADLALARSKAVPDVTVSAGVRNYRETDSNAFVAGITLPLPLFDRNQGGVGEAAAKLDKARRERQAAQTTMHAELAEAWENLAAAHTTVTTLRNDILPGAQRAFDSVQNGYREGKFDFLQLLDAQRTLFEVKGQYVEALSAYHLSRTEIERLIGLPLQTVAGATDQNTQEVN